MDKIVTDLTMLLIYLTGWEEDKNKGSRQGKTLRAFRGYRYEALEELESRGLIRLVRGGKSLFVTDRGKQKAKELKKKYLR